MTSVRLYYPEKTLIQHSITQDSHCKRLEQNTLRKSIVIHNPALVAAPIQTAHFQWLRFWLAANSTEDIYLQNLYYWKLLVFSNSCEQSAIHFINKHILTLNEPLIRPVFLAFSKIMLDAPCLIPLGEFIQNNIETFFQPLVHQHGYMLDTHHVENMYLFTLSRDLLHHFCLIKLAQVISTTAAADNDMCRMLTEKEVLQIERIHFTN